jgi:hypothetical protein
MSNGRTYTVVIEAESTYDAALAFQRHCQNGPPELGRPEVHYDSIVEVKPIYKVSMRKAMVRAAEKQARAGRKKG